MQDKGKTKEQLLIELHELRKRVAELEKDRAEQRLAEQTAIGSSRNYLRTILQAMPDGFFVGDTERRITEANEAYCRMSGYTLAELLSLNIADIDAAEDPAIAAARRRRIIDKGSENFETRHRRKDGSILDVEVSATWVDLGGGRTVCFCRDITERKRAEAALAESEQRFSLAMEATKDGLWDWNMYTNEVYYSPGYLAILGYSSGDVQADVNTWADRIHPEDKDATLKANMDCVENRCDDFEVEFRMQAKNGEWRWILGRGKAAGRDENGRAVRMVGTHTDITERKQTEEALRKSQRQLADIIEFFPDATFVINSEGIVIAWNRAIEEMTGISKSKMIGKGDFEYSLPFFGSRRPILIDHLSASEEKKMEYYDSVSTIGGAIVAETYAPGAYGGKGAYLWSIATALLGEQGNVTGAIESIRDITERKRVENALLESESKFRSFAEQALAGIYILQDGVFKYVNAKFAQMFGYTVEECLNDMHFKNLVCAEDVTKVEEQVRRRTSGEVQFVQHTFRGLKKDGRIFPVEVYGATSVHKGEPAGTGTILDITERKRAEEEKEKLEAQLFQAQKMESVGRLAGGVAHDFNNMLGVIIGRAEMALEQDAITDKLQHNLKEILKAGRRSADLTRQLLAFARKQTAIPKILDLNETISGILNMFRRLIGEDIDLLWAPELDLWKVKIDPSQVDQILANLAVNARDAISGVGAITMRTENVLIDDSQRVDTPELIPGEYVLLTVSDTGSGMSEEVRENIFEPFFTTKELGKGTGLGLSTVYGIVKQNDGFIYVASKLGKGATFNIYLPKFEPETAQVPSEEVAGKLLTGTETILLVEDDEAILNLSKMILEKLGYTVLAAATPRHAIHLVGEHPGDLHLLITDVVMPEMNGRELAEQLGAIRSNLKCLFMSGYTADLIAHHGILDEGLNFIQKPFGSADLAAKVRQVLDHRE